MKKNLRSKILLCVLAGGVLAANTAFAAYTEQITGGNDNYGDIEIRTDDGNGNYTYNLGKNAELNVNGINNGAIYIAKSDEDIKKIEIKDALDITVDNKNHYGNSIGIELYGEGISEGVIIDRSGGGKISVSSEDSEAWQFEKVTGVDIVRGENNIVKLGDTILNIKSLDAKYGSQVTGICIDNSVNSKVIMGNASITTKATFDSTEKASLFENYGIYLADNSQVIADNISIESYSQGNENVPQIMALGVYMENSYITTKNGTKINTVAEGAESVGAYGLFNYGSIVDYNVVNINTKTIGGSIENNNQTESIGVWTRDVSTSNIAGGSITAQAYNSDGITTNEQATVRAILSDDTSTVNVNQGTNNDVVINGDIEAKTNAIINLNLNTINSEINGAIDDNSANGTNLMLANGAEWNNTDASNVTNVSMNGGIINQNTDEDIDIENYSGNGEINFAADNINNNGVLDFNNTGDVTIGTAEIGSVTNLNVNTNNTVDTINSVKANENLNAIANKIYYTNHSDGNITGSVKIAEGFITPEVSGDLLFYEDNSNGHTAGQGYVANVKQNSSTTTIDNIKNIAATAIVAWRQEDSTLSQRLGELRESDGGQGIWVRMSRGEFEYDGEYKNQYNFFQMGYDWAAGSWHYGAAVSHNDGQTTYTHGDGENRSTSLSLYGTWLGDKGHYADIVLKQGRLSNDFDIYTEAGHTSGDYDAWGTSLSGEYGMKVDLDGGWYVTPQAQLTLMRIGGEDYTTNNGIKVNQDSLESAVGRVGFEVGKRISNSGSIYAKASLLHDFAGSADTYLSLNGLTNSYHQDIGDTWCEAGIGFNYKTSENSYVYADVVKTFGGDVETPWQWNAGMRWTF